VIRCELCRQRFGGQFVYDRHIDRRRDRCRTSEELRRRGLRRDRRGVWHQQPPTGQRRLRLWPSQGSRTVEDRGKVKVDAGALSTASDGTPQQPNRGSA